MKIFLAAALVLSSIALLPTAPANAQACDPNYTGACVPDFKTSGDKDCPDIKEKNFKSIGSDPHRLDRDKDGIACERK